MGGEAGWAAVGGETGGATVATCGETGGDLAVTGAGTNVARGDAALTTLGGTCGDAGCDDGFDAGRDAGRDAGCFAAGFASSCPAAPLSLASNTLPSAPFAGLSAVFLVKIPAPSIHVKYLFPWTLPSFLPLVSLSSTPTHSPAPNAVGPLYRTIPITPGRPRT